MSNCDRSPYPKGAQHDRNVRRASEDTRTTDRLPAWCVVDKPEHLAELDDLDGTCLHRSRSVELRTTPDGTADGEMYVGSVTRIDGTPDPEHHELLVQLMGMYSGAASIDDVQRYAIGLLVITTAVQDAQDRTPENFPEPR